MAWRSTYFLLEEVASHNTCHDCWLIIYGVVKNVSGLIEEFRHTDLINPILQEAGQDVSHWFELEGQEPVVSLRQYT
jgi:cytochrome b involved in lipid metabolism